jgi:nucleotide-binding universal stress UspA family protein
MNALEFCTPNRSTLVAPSRILLATDLTDGEHLIPHAVAQAKASGAAITLVHAILPAETLPLDAQGTMAYTGWSGSEEDAERALLAMAAQIEAEGVACEVVSRHGFPADVVEKVIRSSHATRLIMASHGRGKWGQLMMGSVANQILGRVEIPVFVVGPKSVEYPEHRRPQRMMHPVSLSGNYRQGVEMAMALARSFGSELTLLHIPDRDVEASIHPGCTLTWAENLFSMLVPEGVTSAPPIRVQIAFGNVADEIRREAVRMCADWIVLGVEEASALWPLMSSTAYKVLSTANCPVLAFRNDLPVGNEVKEVQPKLAVLLESAAPMASL